MVQRRILDEVARQTFGQDVSVADPSRFEAFLQQNFATFSQQSAQRTPATIPTSGGFDLGGLLATAGEQYQRINRASQSFLPSNQEILGGLADIGRDLITPDIPQGFVERAPRPLQPAARVVREVSSPLGLATLPLGGSARVVGGGLLGAAGGATAGQAIGGDVGETIGAIGGGVAGGIPAVQRLAGRGVTAVGRGGVRLAEEAGRSNVGNVLLPPAPQRVTAASVRGRPTIPVFAQATEADRPAAQAFIDDLVARAGDRTGSVGLQNVVPEGLDDLGIQDLALKLRTADALGIRTTSDGRPLSFLLASRPGQITAQQFRRGAAVTVDAAGPGQGRTTYIGFNLGARPAAASSLASRTAPTTAAPLQGRQVAHAATEGRPPQIEKVIQDGGGIRTEDFKIRKYDGGPELPATRDRVDAWEGEALNVLDQNPNYSTAAALRQMAATIERQGVGELADMSAGVSGSQLELAEQLLGKDLAGLPPRVVAAEMRATAERLTVRAQNTLRRIADVRLQAEEAAIRRGMAAAIRPPVGVPPAAVGGAGRGAVPTDAAAQLEREVAAARLEQEVATAGKALPQSSAEAALEAEVAAARGGLPPRGPQIPAEGIQPPIPDDPVPRLVTAIQNVKRLSPQLRAELAEKRRLELGGRVGVGMERAAGVAPSRKAGALRSALSGELPRIPVLEPVRGQFSPDDIETLYGRIWRSSLRDLEKGNASDALVRVLLPEGLDVPTPSEMTLLERVFGPEMRRALEDVSKGQVRKVWEAAADLLNVTRALKSSFDISAMFRQGAILSVAHPQKAFGGRDSAFVRMLRSFRSPQAHEESLARIRTDPDFDLIAGAGRKNPLFIADAAETKITAREEAFMSRYATRIPGIKGSHRAFNTYLNEMKWKTAKSYVDGLRKEGVTVTPDSQGLDTMTRFLNVATGRGKLGFLEPRQGRDTAAQTRQLLLEMATTVFWSPRLTVSRFQVPIEGLRALGSITPEIRLGGRRVLGTADPALRAASRQLAGDLVKYTGAVLSFLTLLKLSNLAEVEVDPRSSDFGKIRVGGVRIDAWAGFQPPMRYTAQWIMGQSKPITAGGIQDVPRDRTFGKFLRSKLSPGAVGQIATFLPKDTPLSGLTGGGRTFIGERIVPGTARPFKTVPDRTKSLYGELLDEFVTPLIYGDIDEAIRSEGLAPGMILGAAGLVGFGVTSIPEDETQRQPQGQTVPGLLR